MQGCGTKGIFSFAKENIPFGTPRERRLDWQSRTRMTLMPPECRCLRGSIASLAANGSARRFASASIIRCRSAHLVEVRSNLRLPRHYSMRRAPAMPPWQAKANLLKSVIDGDCVRLPNRRQSDSEDRRKSNRIATKIAGTRFGKRRSSSSCSLAMSKPFSWGIKRGRFSFVKENLPLYPSPARRREPNPFPKGK